MIGIGIDTGGTCTDAVVFDITERCILASAKSQTTHDHLEQGIGNSLDKLPKDEKLSAIAYGGYDLYIYEKKQAEEYGY